MTPEQGATPLPTRVPEVPGVTDLVEIGRGGYGVVYRGHQPDLDRDVAVKVLSAPGLDERAVERWRREVTAMGRLSNHPNIVGVFSAGVTEGGHPYLVMPYAAGGSLHDLVGREGPLPPAEAARIGARLAGALAAAHAAGVLHRDVKPGNVLLTEYDEPQLSDFGIARLTDSATTSTGSVQATIGYAAPEVLSGRPATEAADVYGLGATLHAALSGQAPFAGPPDEPLMGRIGRVVAMPPPDLRPLGVPAALAALVERCLAKEPGDRPASAAAVRDELEAMAGTPALLAAAAADPAPGGATATEVLAPVPVAAPRREGPRPAVVALVVLAALAVVALAAAAAWALGGDDGGERAAPTTVPPPTEAVAPSTTAAPGSTGTTEAAATTAPPATVSTPQTTAPPAPEPPGEGAYKDAVGRYYGLVREGRLEESWALLSPRFQQEQTYDGYVAYWTETIDTVEVQGEPRPDVDAGTVALTLRYATTDGRRTTEEVVLTFLTADDGTLLIDDYSVVASRGDGGDGDEGGEGGGRGDDDD